jgi:hypothetical protein
MQLPPQELQDDLTTAFAALQATCVEPEAVKRHWPDWVSADMWLLIKQGTSLRRAGQLGWCIGQCIKRTIYAVLKMDRTARMA